MNFSIPIVAYLSPLLVGLIVPLLLNDRKQKIFVLLLKIIIPSLVISLIIAFLHIVSKPTGFSLNIARFLYFVIFLSGWALFTAGIYYLFITLGAGKDISYLIISLIILLMNTTIFYVNPIISAVQDNTVLRQKIIEVAININPILTIATNFFHHDLLRSSTIYSICDIGSYYFYSYAHWVTILIYYLIIGVFTFILAVIPNGIKSQ
jgi:hypothetical protein